MLDHMIADHDIEGFVGKRQIGSLDDLELEPIADHPAIDHIHSLDLMLGGSGGKVVSDAPRATAYLEDMQRSGHPVDLQQTLDLLGL